MVLRFWHSTGFDYPTVIDPQPYVQKLLQYRHPQPAETKRLFVYQNHWTFTHFTVLALVIAGLGLFALSAFTAEQRKKEIGISKVLGASNTNIFYKLSIEFVLLVLISFLLASVIAYFVMKEWLLDFQYSVEIGPGIFLLAGFASVFIALITISFQALRAAFSNPVMRFERTEL
jgi:ABC-type antimicrobial peptide transport system permease subunit